MGIGKAEIGIKKNDTFAKTTQGSCQIDRRVGLTNAAFTASVIAMDVAIMFNLNPYLLAQLLRDY